MVRDLNVNKIEELKTELKNVFPELSNEDFATINNSIDDLVNSISMKVQKDKVEIEKQLVDRIDFINSKHLI